MKKIIITLAFAALLAGCDRNTSTTDTSRSMDNSTITNHDSLYSTNNMMGTTNMGTTNMPPNP